MRTDGRKPEEMRPLTFRRRYTRQAPGSVLVRQGRTLVLCTCTVEPAVPAFLLGSGKGWLTAEYGMLPGSTGTRKPRDRGGKVDGRSVEIQRLIGRSLRAVVNLQALGERTLWVDCDVLEADGGTRTASINGALVALADALQTLTPVIGPRDAVLRDTVAAISVGSVDGVERLDPWSPSAAAAHQGVIMAFEIRYSSEAVEQLERLRSFDSAAIVTEIEQVLTVNPTLVSKARVKLLRQPAPTQYRLRVGDYRVFYDVAAANQVVHVIQILSKDNALTFLKENP